MQSLFGSLVAGTYDGPKLTADQVEKLSEKIDELVGGPRSSDMAQIHNEKSEVNMFIRFYLAFVRSTL